LAVLLIVTIILASVSVGLLVKGQGVERPVIQRLTDVAYARQSISYRMQPIKLAIKSAIVRPTGAGYYSWFQRTGSPIWPHNDFFLALGIYGIPGGLLFALILLVMIYTVKRTPLGIEKLFVRAELTFLIIMGLNIGQIYHKYFWVFLGFIIAGERVAKLYLESSNLPPVVEPEESLLQYELV
jgi:O-antigen ligase